MTTTTKLVGAPIALDELAPIPNKGLNGGDIHRIQITFDCGTYNDILVFEFQTESDKKYAAMMWQQFIEKAKDYATV